RDEWNLHVAANEGKNPQPPVPADPRSLRPDFLYDLRKIAQVSPHNIETRLYDLADRMEEDLTKREAEVIERGVELASARAPDAELRAALRSIAEDDPAGHTWCEAYRALREQARAALASSPAPVEGDAD